MEGSSTTARSAPRFLVVDGGLYSTVCIPYLDLFSCLSVPVFSFFSISDPSLLVLVGHLPS